MADWYIDPSGLHSPIGSDSSDGTNGTPWETLAKALRSSSAGDGLYVYGEIDSTLDYIPAGTLPGPCIISSGQIDYYGILTDAFAFHASGILAASGTDYRAYGCLDIGGTTAQDYGIVDNAGVLTSQGCLDSSHDAEDHGLINSTGVYSASGIIKADGTNIDYGCLNHDATTMESDGIIDADGEYHADGVLEADGHRHALSDTDSSPYLTGETTGEDNQRLADQTEVNGNVTKIKLGEIVLTGCDPGTLVATGRKRIGALRG